VPLPTKGWSRSIEDCHPYLQVRWPEVQSMLRKKTGVDWFITCTWRSVKAQQRLYAQGRTTPGPIVTWVDGVSKMSRHNVYPAQAIDVCADTDPDVMKVKVSYDWRLYVPLIAISSLNELESGGAWKKKDWAHCQIPAGVLHELAKPA